MVTVDADLTATGAVLAARTTEESGGSGNKTLHVQSGPTGGQFTSSNTSKATTAQPKARRPAPKRPASKSQVAPIQKKRQTLSRKGPNDPEQVKQLQALLKELKISGLSVDGNFGGDTEAAVKAVQEKLGIKPTGRCSASLLGTLEKVHALSPCVVRASSQVLAAAGPVGYDDDEVLDKVEVAPGTWVCAHADGTVSMRMTSDDMAKWAGAVLEMAAAADDEDDDANGEYVEARRSYPGQKWRHGWIPFGRGKPDAPTASALMDDRPTSMSDLAYELEGLEPEEKVAKLRAWGYSPDEIDQILGSVRAAAGHDTTAGHDELHHFWTQGPGLARWAESPTPWTTLVALLSEHVPPEKARVFASRWFIEVFGYAAGSDKNRVAHGHKPRGEKVGPG